MKNLLQFNIEQAQKQKRLTVLSIADHLLSNEGYTLDKKNMDPNVLIYKHESLNIIVGFNLIHKVTAINSKEQHTHLSESLNMAVASKKSELGWI